MGRRILVAASGTGGHIFPALAVAEHLDDWQVEWLGVPDRLEREILADRYPLHLIGMGGLQERSWRAWGQTLLQFGRSIGQVRRLIRQRHIDVILTTGGYIAAPAIVAGAWCGIPVVLHESNALPGKVTRGFGRWCRRVILGFPEAAARLPGIPTEVVGTPVRQSFMTATGEVGIPAQQPLILVMGGSQGARGLNRMVVACAPDWLAAGAHIIHLTGTTDAEAMKALAPRDPNYQLFPFRDDVAQLLRRAQFVVSRSGAASLAELSVMGVPAILIPYPYAAEDHQWVNAHAFAVSHPAVILRESFENEALLRQQGLDWLASPPLVTGISPHRDAAQRIAQVLNTVCKEIREERQAVR
ncbi:MAG: undecaprenyldiphospho-muramoylpentapeptide beta-N-acetylglucosaminyltransferase [Synechococcales cyanobacterium]